MIIGDRIPRLREEMKPSQDGIEKRAGLLRCYMRARHRRNSASEKSWNEVAWGSVAKEARYLNKLRPLLSKSDEADRNLLLQMAQKMALRHPAPPSYRSSTPLPYSGPIHGLTRYDFSAILAA